MEALTPFGVALVATRIHCITAGTHSPWSCGIYPTLVLADFVTDKQESRWLLHHAAYARARGQAREVN